MFEPFNHQKAEALPEEEVLEHARMSACDVLDEVKKILTTEDSWYRYLINLSELSTFTNIDQEIMDKYLFFDGIPLSPVIFYHKLRSTQVRWAVENCDLSVCEIQSAEHTFRIATDGILRHPLNNRIRIALVHNRALMGHLVKCPKIFRKLFPDAGLPIRVLCKQYVKSSVYGEGLKLQNLLESFFEEINLNAQEKRYFVDHTAKDLTILAKPADTVYSDCLGTLRHCMLYQKMTYDELKSLLGCWFERAMKHGFAGWGGGKYGLNDLCYMLATDESLPAELIPSWSRLDDPRRISECMPEEYVKKFTKAKNIRILTWFTAVCPKKVLPALLGHNEEISEMVSKRLQNEDNRKMRGNILNELFRT